MDGALQWQERPKPIDLNRKVTASARIGIEVGDAAGACQRASSRSSESVAPLAASHVAGPRQAVERVREADLCDFSVAGLPRAAPET